MSSAATEAPPPATTALTGGGRTPTTTAPALASATTTTATTSTNTATNQAASAAKDKKNEIRVYKKSSLNGKITVYLGKRDFVDHVDYVDPIDGVVLVDRDYVRDRKVFGHVLATFSYGRDDLDVLGLTFRKELYLVTEQIFPDPHRRHYSKACPYFVGDSTATLDNGPTDAGNVDNHSNMNHQQKPPRPLTRLQERLVKKLGSNAFPFFFELPPLCPASVTLQPGPGDSGKPCGVDYELKAYIASSLEEQPSKRDSIRLAIRKIMYAPSKQGEQPMVEVSKDFMMSPNKLNLEVSLDKDLYHHGESIAVNVHVSNNSNRTVKKVKVSVRQFADICLFSTAQYKCTVAEVESEEGCPVGPGATLSKVYYLRPLLAFNKDKRGLALDGQLKHEDTNLASSTLLTDQSQKENLGIVVQYKVRVKLALGPLGGEIAAELPVILMHPKPEGDDELSATGPMSKGVPVGAKDRDALLASALASKNPLEPIFGRTTACKCEKEKSQKEANQANSTVSADGSTGNIAKSTTGNLDEKLDKAKSPHEHDLIQLDDDIDNIIFEDFARLQLETTDLSGSSKSNDELYPYNTSTTPTTTAPSMSNTTAPHLVKTITANDAASATPASSSINNHVSNNINSTTPPSISRLTNSDDNGHIDRSTHFTSQTQQLEGGNVSRLNASDSSAATPTDGDQHQTPINSNDQ